MTSRSSTARSGSSATSSRLATTTSRCRRNGMCTHRIWRPYFVAAEHGLVGAVLSGRQHETADRSALRRLPFRQLQHPDEDGRLNGTSAANGATAPAASTSTIRAAANIVNPGAARLRARQRHVHPVPFTGTAVEESDRGSATYDWPVGFQQGLNLKDFWELEEHKLGETTFTHFADGTAHKNRMQGNDFVQSVMYTRGVTCFSCHDVHGTGNNARSDQAGRAISA